MKSMLFVCVLLLCGAFAAACTQAAEKTPTAKPVADTPEEGKTLMVTVSGMM